MDFPKFRAPSGLDFFICLFVFLISHHHLTRQFSLSNIKGLLVKCLVNFWEARGKDTWKSGCKQDKSETKAFLKYIDSRGRK